MRIAEVSLIETCHNRVNEMEVAVQQVDQKNRYPTYSSVKGGFFLDWTSRISGGGE